MNTSILKVDPLKIVFDGIQCIVPNSQTLSNLKTASEVLRNNQPVAFPTETVYGLGASCQNDAAVQSIYAAKNRPADNPLIIHVSSREQLESTLLRNAPEPKIPEIYHQLIEKFWPGPLTVLLPLPKDTTISPICTLGQTTFGVRVPSHPVARALIDISGLPLAAPSANASTRPSCTTAEHVYEDLHGRIPLILDGGPADVGVESTVVDGLVSPPQILRPGGVSIEQIKLHGGKAWSDVVVARPNAKENEKVRTPGMKYRHYSPTSRVVLFVPTATSDLHKVQDWVKHYMSTETVHKVALLRSKTWPANLLANTTETVDLPLGATGKDIAHNLFTRFRQADAAGVDLIVVEGVELVDEGLAIMNRAQKAAFQVVSW